MHWLLLYTTLALSQGATFVAQGFAGNVNQVVEMIKEGINHKGFSLVNILQPCVTFNKVNTYQYYLKHIYKLPDDNQKNNLEEAIKKGMEMTTAEKFPLGILYQVKKPAFTDELSQLAKLSLQEKPRFINFNDLSTDFR